MPFLLLLAIVVLSIVFPAVSKTPADAPAGINSADTAWMLTAAALVLIMTPGLAFSMGGMVSQEKCDQHDAAKFYQHGGDHHTWVIVGFSLAFGDSFHGIIGNPGTFFL